MDEVAPLQGAFVECGVGNGRTLTILAYFAQKQYRELYGFDSFMGFPEPSNEDNSKRNPQKGEWGHITPKDIFASLTNSGLTMKPSLLEGFFENTIPKFKASQTPIAFLHIDADLYQSYRDCFELIPLVVSGGIILFDEYNEPNWPGATRAVDELCLEHSLSLKRTPILGKHYIKVL